MMIESDLILFYKSGRSIRIPKEAIDKYSFANMRWDHEKKNDLTSPLRFIYDYVMLEFIKEKLDNKTIDKLLNYKDLLLVKIKENGKFVKKYVSWGWGKDKNINFFQKNEENLIYIGISSIRGRR